jgi:hypothetical protein
MKAKLRRVFLIVIASAYAILWVLSRIGPVTQHLQNWKVVEVFGTALIFYLLWELIVFEDIRKLSDNSIERMSQELNNLSSLLDALISFLKIKTESNKSIPTYSLIKKAHEKYTHDLRTILERAELEISGHGPLYEEAIKMMREAKHQVMAKNHVPPAIWKQDSLGKVMPRFLDEQKKLGDHLKIIRIHIFSEQEIQSYSDNDWNNLEWLANEHTKASMEFVLCSMSWDNASAEYVGKGLILIDPEDCKSMLLVELPIIGAPQGKIVMNKDRIIAARDHVLWLYDHSMQWDAFKLEYFGSKHHE